MNNNSIRNLLVIGIGDGGCNIASAISKRIPDETFVIAYNTSMANMDAINANIKIAPADEDGAGHVRAYSKEIFKDGVYKNLLESVKDVCANQSISYIVITTTTAGGTGSGSSPMAAKLIADNVDVPVIVVGVYPTTDDDAIAQYNAMEWQREIDKIGLPYMIWDNDQEGSIGETHTAVNDSIAEIMSLFAGVRYGASTISMIDSRNLYMLLAHTGGRIVSAISTTRMNSKESIDEYLDNILHASMQPMPNDSVGLGIFVKGPKELIERVRSESFTRIREYGQPVLQFNHLEESEDLTIAIIMAGCSEPTDRIMIMKNRYDDIINAVNRKRASIMTNLDIIDPLGTSRKTKVSAEPDFSALEM